MSDLIDEPDGFEHEPDTDDELLEAQEQTGYGEDEGEREESLPSE